MTDYRVVWEIDIEADTPREAAEHALNIQQKHYTTATVFDVIDKKTLETTRVDLYSEEDDY
jgi:hypothetical protein